MHNIIGVDVALCRDEGIADIVGNVAKVASVGQRNAVIASCVVVSKTTRGCPFDIFDRCAAGIIKIGTRNEIILQYGKICFRRAVFIGGKIDVCMK